MELRRSFCLHILRQSVSLMETLFADSFILLDTLLIIDS